MSQMFVDKITLPTNGLSITLKAIAIVDNFTSAILEENYFTDSMDLDRTRLTGREGINILPPGKPAVNSLSFDSDGNAAQQTSIVLDKLDFLASTTNSRGEDIPGSTTLDFVNFPIKIKEYEVKKVTYLNSIDFDPKSMYIIMDGTTASAISNQTVRIVNRPHGSMNLYSPLHRDNNSNSNLVTANFVRYMINPRNGKITFYYRESRENRWVKSTQQIEGGSPLNISFNSGGHPQSFVFRWIEHRSMSKIF
jgi:hypothetical protein